MWRADECGRIEKCGFLSRIRLTGFVGWGKFSERDRLWQKET